MTWPRGPSAGAYVGSGGGLGGPEAAGTVPVCLASVAPAGVAPKAHQGSKERECDLKRGTGPVSPATALLSRSPMARPTGVGAEVCELTSHHKTICFTVAETLLTVTEG